VIRQFREKCTPEEVKRCIRHEPGDDMFTLWQRYAQERLGLKLQSTRGLVTVVVVNSAERIPEAN
jgi:uncharacterized protein (TIGR03435 family)